MILLLFLIIKKQVATYKKNLNMVIGGEYYLLE